MYCLKGFRIFLECGTHCLTLGSELKYFLYFVEYIHKTLSIKNALPEISYKSLQGLNI